MSEDKTSYNPFNPVGRYNLETYLYKHRQAVLGFTILFILLLFGIGWFVWYEGKAPPKPDLPPSPKPPPPKYGYGPYGYGLYAPPRAFFENPPDLTE